jgi:molybdate transport system substrate-binding protein
MRRHLLAVVLALILTGCSSPTSSDGTAEGPAVEGPALTGELTGELTVFAAASLADVTDELSALLQADHPDLEVLVNLAGSQQLAGQLVEGAQADIYAAASDGPMGRVAQAGLLDGEPRTFARNRLEIAVEPGNPRGIAGLADLADDELVLVLAAPEVPAGQYAAEALDAVGVSVEPDSLEVDVRAALSKVALGEADAAIVYRTDVLAAGDRVSGLEIPAADNVLASYPIGLLRAAPNPRAARAFLDLLTSDRGRDVLLAAGFEVP